MAARLALVHAANAVRDFMWFFIWRCRLMWFHLILVWQLKHAMNWFYHVTKLDIFVIDSKAEYRRLIFVVRFCWLTKSADKNWLRISANFSKQMHDGRRWGYGFILSFFKRRRRKRKKNRSVRVRHWIMKRFVRIGSCWTFHF